MSKRQKLVVSFLKSMYDTNPDLVSLDQIYQLLILDTLRADTEKHRYYKSVPLKKEAEDIKNNMCNFIPAAIMSGGKQVKNIQGCTGMSMADFDHLPPDNLERCLSLLRADPYVIMAYVTISNEGIRVIYLTDITEPQHHADAFAQGNSYYAQLLGHEYDKKCKNIGRTSILCYCPQAIYHPDAQPMHILLNDEKSSSASSNGKAKKKVGRPPKTFKNSAEQVTDAIFLMLESEGKTYTEGHHNEYVSSALYLMNRFGVEQEEAREWAVNQFTDYQASKIESVTRSVYQHTEEHGTLKLQKKRNDSYPFASIPELKEFLSSQAEYRNNVITEKREIRMDDEVAFRDISDRDENTLWARANTEGVFSGPTPIQMILNSEYVPNFNPFIDYLTKLKKWNGVTDYLSQLADTAHTTHQDIFRIYFKKWFVGFVASLIQPDIVNHEVLVFIGKQGCYKTTWMNRLLPPELSRYFYTKTNSNRLEKDDKLSLSEFALICFEEIDNMRNSEMNQFKAMVSMPATNERSSYARNKMYRPHIASFCGTGNNLQFLNDPTGTRRWLAFEIESIDNPYEAHLPYSEIYAQAIALYRSGFQYWFSPDEYDLLAKNNEKFEVPNLEKELIQTYYRKPLPGEHGVFVSTSEMLQRINALIKNPLSITNIGINMRKLGFESCRSNSIRGYRVMEFTDKEILARKQQIDQVTNQKLSF